MFLPRFGQVEIFDQDELEPSLHHENYIQPKTKFSFIIFNWNIVILNLRSEKYKHWIWSRMRKTTSHKHVLRKIMYVVKLDIK